MAKQLLEDYFDSRGVFQVEIVGQFDRPTAISKLSANAQRAPGVALVVCPQVLAKHIARPWRVAFASMSMATGTRT